MVWDSLAKNHTNKKGPFGTTIRVRHTLRRGKIYYISKRTLMMIGIANFWWALNLISTSEVRVLEKCTKITAATTEWKKRQRLSPKL